MLLHDFTLKEYSMNGSTTPSLLTLNTTEPPPLGTTSLMVRLASCEKFSLVFTLRMYRMNLSTGSLPLLLVVQLSVIQRDPASVVVTLEGGSGYSVRISK
jgi:hypothetical protein